MKKSIDGAALEMTRVEGKTLATIGYIAERKDLALEFTRGPVIVYHEVPETVFNELFDSDAPDDYFEKNIRYVYKNNRVW